MRAWLRRCMVRRTRSFQKAKKFMRRMDCGKFKVHLCALATTLFATLMPSICGATSITIAPSTATITEGDALTLNVNVDDAAGLFLFQFGVSYDPLVFLRAGAAERIAVRRGQRLPARLSLRRFVRAEPRGNHHADFGLRGSRGPAGDERNAGGAFVPSALANRVVAHLADDRRRPISTGCSTRASIRSTCRSLAARRWRSTRSRRRSRLPGRSLNRRLRRCLNRRRSGSCSRVSCWAFGRG